MFCDIDEVLVGMWPNGSSNGLVQYYAHNHLFSLVAVLNSDGSVYSRYEYDAYGKPHRLNADFTAATGIDFYKITLAFTGRRIDILDNGNLQLQYNRNRYYDYDTGRWLTNDPLRYYDGLNLYEYAHGRSLLGVDPLGNLDCKVAMVNCSLAPNSKCCKKRVELTNPLGAYNHYINGDGQPATLSPGLVDDIKGTSKYCRYLNGARSLILSHMPTSCNQERRYFSFTQDNVGKYIGDEDYEDGKAYRYTNGRNILNPNLSTTVGGFDLRFYASCYSESDDIYPRLQNGRMACGCNARVSCTIKYTFHDTYTFKDTGSEAPGFFDDPLACAALSAKGFVDNRFDDLASFLRALAMGYSLLDSAFGNIGSEAKPYEITKQWTEKESEEKWIVDKFPLLAG